MEPFGILEFLKPLLDTKPETPLAKEGESERETPIQPTQEENEPAPQANSQDAFLQFIQAHEARASRFRR